MYHRLYIKITDDLYTEIASFAPSAPHSPGTEIKDYHRLFPIYKQKPVGTRFVQMVSKNSRMGNLVGIGVYNLQNPFKVTERVWMEANHGSIQMVNTFCVWKFRLGILDYLSRIRFLWKFSVWEDLSRLTIYIQTEISGFLW